MVSVGVTWYIYWSFLGYVTVVDRSHNLSFTCYVEYRLLVYATESGAVKERKRCAQSTKRTRASSQRRSRARSTQELWRFRSIAALTDLSRTNLIFVVVMLIVVLLNSSLQYPTACCWSLESRFIIFSPIPVSSSSSSSGWYRSDDDIANR